MAYTAHKNPEQLKERYDTEDELNAKVDQLVALIKNSKHMIAFTGAGISTSAGIPDFRGPEGVWTLAATGGKRTLPTMNKLSAIPTSTHMSLVKLQQEKVLKFLVSQNCDGLHRKSGIQPNFISELHGNSNIEQCMNCGKEYLRDFDATATYQFSVFDHRTGRRCVLCGGDLVDTIINFGEDLPQEAISMGFHQAEKADLCLVLGSSLTVSPACNIPETVGRSKNGTLVICNLQHTPYDKLALKIYAKTDVLMEKVMAKLGYQIPPFMVNRRVCCEVNNGTLIVGGVDFDATPASIFPGVKINGERLESEPFAYKLQGKPKVDAELFFFGHYNEPKVPLQIDCTKVGKTFFDLSYNPLTGKWIIDDNQDNKKWVKVTKRAPRPLKQDIPKTPLVAQGDNKPGGFSVQPKTDCPHVGTVAVGATAFVDIAFKANKCHSCQDPTENWVCLVCGECCCSRYVKSHMSEHNNASGHAIALSFSDLSCWCYACDDYILDPYLTQGPINQLHTLKFGSGIKR